MKTYIWASPMRLFHWFLFVSIVCAYIVAEDELLNIHAAFGYSALILIMYRIIYGFTGPAYSRFKDFPVKFSTLKTYLGNMKASKQNYPGHNPASAVIMLAILADIFFTGVSGMLAFGAQGHGLLKAWIQPGNEDFFKEIHELFAILLVILVLIHLAGLALDFYQNRKAGTLKSIFTGFKTIEGESIKESRGQNILLALTVVIVVTVFAYTAKLNTQAEPKEHQEHQEEFEDED
jgi:cytochrome b